MNQKELINKGDIYICDLPGTDTKGKDGINPVIVVRSEDDDGCVAVVPTVSVPPGSYSLMNVNITGQIPGFKSRCALCGSIRTVKTKTLLKRIGKIENSYLLKNIDFGVLLGLGFINRSTGDRGEDIRCLCSKCISELEYAGLDIRKYRKNGNTDKCDKCGRPGYDCLVS